MSHDRWALGVIIRWVNPFKPLRSTAAAAKGSGTAAAVDTPSSWMHTLWTITYPKHHVTSTLCVCSVCALLCYVDGKVRKVHRGSLCGHTTSTSRQSMGTSGSRPSSTRASCGLNGSRRCCRRARTRSLWMSRWVTWQLLVCPALRHALAAACTQHTQGLLITHVTDPQADTTISRPAACAGV